VIEILFRQKSGSGVVAQNTQAAGETGIQWPKTAVFNDAVKGRGSSRYKFHILIASG